MTVITKSDYESLSREAAHAVVDAIHADPGVTLGLPTGGTPLGMYEELVSLYRQGLVDFSNVRTFNMDEYLGMTSGDPRSFDAYMKMRLFDHVNIAPENTHIPGDPRNCDAYEKEIEDAGGIDLQILGIGLNGHIGFNEPGSVFSSRTRPVQLSESTVAEIEKHFPDKAATPTEAVTIGIATILDARRIILLASGAGKADVVAKTIEGPMTKDLPASALKLHSNVTIILDKAAASRLSPVSSGF